jgi:two-component system OmpR family sensor kinase
MHEAGQEHAENVENDQAERDVGDPPDLLARLSEPFERGGAQEEGAGLGLAIAKAIASGIGGKIELISPQEGRQDGFEARFILANEKKRHKPS